MDDALCARADLRSYALRRCIRFYTAIVLVAILVSANQLLTDTASQREVFLLAAILLGVLAAVEVASGLVIAQITKVRDSTPGPETGLWRFAQGPAPSWLAAAGFVVVASLFAWASTV